MRLPSPRFATRVLAIAVLLLGGCVSAPMRNTGSFVDRDVDAKGQDSGPVMAYESDDEA